jgi:hypothetical protein
LSVTPQDSANRSRLCIPASSILMPYWKHLILATWIMTATSGSIKKMVWFIFGAHMLDSLLHRAIDRSFFRFTFQEFWVLASLEYIQFSTRLLTTPGTGWQLSAFQIRIREVAGSKSTRSPALPLHVFGSFFRPSKANSGLSASITPQSLS